MCQAIRPPVLVVECVWNFFAEPQWIGPAVEAFTRIGYYVSYRPVAAGPLLPQERQRGILTALRTDAARQVAAGRSRCLEWVPQGPGPNLRDFGCWETGDGDDQPLYLTQDLEWAYSPRRACEDRWPWATYRRIPMQSQKAPTLMASYGRAHEYLGQGKGIHGFFKEARGGLRFLAPWELRPLKDSREGLRCTRTWPMVGGCWGTPSRHRWRWLGSHL